MSQKRELRRAAAFPSFISPLFCVEWWRLVLDEMHLVEHSSRLLTCCSQLRRIHVWCVSGTPFNRSLDEMNGVMNLLSIRHYCDSAIWKECVSVPLSRLCDVENPYNCHDTSVLPLLQGLIDEYYWCTTLEDIARLSPALIPPQHRVLHRVQLTAIEVRVCRCDER